MKVCSFQDKIQFDVLKIDYSLKTWEYFRKPLLQLEYTQDLPGGLIKTPISEGVSKVWESGLLLGSQDHLEPESLHRVKRHSEQSRL